MAYQSKNHRKFLATSLTAAMVASAVAPAVSAASFPDVKDDNFYAPYVSQLADAGIIEGMPNGNFGLREKVTRAQAAKMVSLIRALDTKSAPAASFEDVKQNAWYSEYVNALYASKLVDGVSEKEFAPNGTLTRAQFAKLVVDAYGLELKPETKTPFTDVKENVWYTDYVKTLYAHKLINGKTATTFEPNATIDRADFAKLLVDADLQYGFTLGVPNVAGITATAPNTLTVTGTALKGLKVEHLTVEGNKVTAVTPSADGKSATVTLENTLTPGKEYKVTTKIKDVTKDYTVKFTYDVNSVAVTTTVLDDDKNGQKIDFNVNGQPVNWDYLVNVSGWDVEFQSNKAVFESNGSASTTSSTGEIREQAININDTFNVKVVLSKNGVTVESLFASVSVVNDNETPAIGSIALENSDDVLMNSKTLVTGETAQIAGIYSNTDDVIDISGSATYASSNQAVATVSSTGEITAVAPGKTTITVTAGTKKYTVDLTVSDTARKVTRLVPAQTAVKVSPGVDPVVSVTAYDQYGDKIAVTSTAVEEASTLAVSDYTAAANGVGSVTVTTNSNTTAGTYPVYLKVGGVVVGQFSVVVTSDNVANNAKLESTKTSVDLAGTNTLTLKANLYTTSGGYVETLTPGAVTGNGSTVALTDSDGNSYSVQVVKPSVATLSVDNGNLVVTGASAGSTDIVLKDANGVQIAKYTVTVNNTVTKVTAVTWKANGNTVSNQGVNLSVYDALTIDRVNGDDIVKGLTLSKSTTAKVRIDESDLSATTADIYLDLDDDGVLDAGEKLGEVSVTVAPDATGVTASSLGALDTTAVGDKGTFIFTFTDTVSNPSKVLNSTTLKVDVK